MMSESAANPSADGDAAPPALPNVNEALMGLLANQQTLMENQQKSMDNQSKTLETITTAISALSAAISANQPNGSGTGSARSNQSTHPQPSPQKPPTVSASLRPSSEAYVGEHGSSKLAVEQFQKATALPDGQKKLSMTRGAATPFVERLATSSRSNNFDSLLHIYTEGDGTIGSAPKTVGGVKVADIALTKPKHLLEDLSELMSLSVGLVVLLQQLAFLYWGNGNRKRQTYNSKADFEIAPFTDNDLNTDSLTDSVVNRCLALRTLQGFRVLATILAGFLKENLTDAAYNALLGQKALFSFVNPVTNQVCLDGLIMTGIYVTNSTVVVTINVEKLVTKLNSFSLLKEDDYNFNELVGRVQKTAQEILKDAPKRLDSLYWWRVLMKAAKEFNNKRWLRLLEDADTNVVIKNKDPTDELKILVALFIKMSDDGEWKQDDGPVTFAALTSKMQKMEQDNKKLGEKLNALKSSKKPTKPTKPANSSLKTTFGTHSFVANGFPKTCPIISKDTPEKSRMWLYNKVGQFIIGPDGKGYVFCSKRHGDTGQYMPYPHDCDKWYAKRQQFKNRRGKTDRDPKSSEASGAGNDATAKKRKLVAREKLVSSLTTYTNLDAENLEKIAELALEEAESLKE